MFRSLGMLFIVLFGLAMIAGSSRAFAGVIVYSQENCPPCHQVKNYLDSKGVNYTDCDVNTSESCMSRFNALGGSGTPLTMINKDRVEGFNKFELDQALKRNGYIK